MGNVDKWEGWGGWDWNEVARVKIAIVCSRLGQHKLKRTKKVGRRREGKMQMGYYFSFCIPSNCNHRQMSESVTASAELLLREQNLCLKIIRHSVCCCLL